MPTPIKPSILIVEDNPDLLHYFTLSFQAFDWSVRAARGVNEATVELMLPEPSLILSDIQLIDGSGLSLLALHRKLKLKAPFFLMSSHDAPVARELAMLGVQGYFVKPFMVKDVIAELRRSLATAA